MSNNNTNQTDRFVVVDTSIPGFDLSGLDMSKQPIMIALARNSEPFLQINPHRFRDDQTVKDVLDALNDPKVPFAVIRPGYDFRDPDSVPSDRMVVLDEREGSTVAEIARVAVLNDWGHTLIETLSEERARTHGIPLPENRV